MICFAPRIMLETKVKYMQFLSYCLIDAKQTGSEFQKKVFLVTLTVLVYSFNNQTTTLWNSSNTTDNALLQRLCLSLLVPAPLNLYGVYSSDIDECNAANNSCHENAWCNNTQFKDHSLAPASQGTKVMDTIVQVKFLVFSNPFKTISLSLRGD